MAVPADQEIHKGFARKGVKELAPHLRIDEHDGSRYADPDWPARSRNSSPCFGIGGVSGPTESCLSTTSVLPKPAGDRNRIDRDPFPPGALISGAMEFPVMDPAQRNREFIACFAAERPRLHVAEVMRVRGLAAADGARLLGHVAKVITVTMAARFR